VAECPAEMAHAGESCVQCNLEDAAMLMERIAQLSVRAVEAPSLDVARDYIRRAGCAKSGSVGRARPG